MDDGRSWVGCYWFLWVLFALDAQAEVSIRFRPDSPSPGDLLRIEVTATGLSSTEDLKITIVRYEDRNGDCIYEEQTERERFEQLVRLEPTDDKAGESRIDFGFQTIGEAPKALRYVAAVTYKDRPYYTYTPVITGGKSVYKTCSVQLPSVWKLGGKTRERLLRGLSAWKDRLTRRDAGGCSGIVWFTRRARCQYLRLPAGFMAHSVALSPEGKRLAVLGGNEEADALLWIDLRQPSSFQYLRQESLRQEGKITTMGWLTEESILVAGRNGAYVVSVLANKEMAFASDVRIREILAIRPLKNNLTRIVVSGERSGDIARHFYSLEGSSPWMEISSKELVSSRLWPLAKWTSENGRRYARGSSESLLEGRSEKESEVCRTEEGSIGDISWSGNRGLAALVCF